MFTGLTAFQLTRGDAELALHRAQRDAPRLAAERDPLRGDLQRAGHRHVSPLALRGVSYRPLGADALLKRNLLVYGAGGVVAPFIAIKAIDVVVSALHLA